MLCEHSSVCHVAALCPRARWRPGGWRPMDLTLFSCMPSSARGWVCTCAAKKGGVAPPFPEMHWGVRVSAGWTTGGARPAAGGHDAGRS